MSKPIIRSSSADRILSCNGSLTLVPMCVNKGGADATLGTSLHWSTADTLIAEHGAVGDIGPEPERPKQAEFDKWLVGFCVREVRDNTPEGWSLEVEVPLSYEWDRFILSGHIDALAVSPDATRARGWDHKMGYDPVEPADNNDQVASYCILLKRAYPDLKEVTFSITQPRNDEDEGFERVSTVTVTNLDALMAVMESRFNAALDNRMELNSGKKQCNWCPAKILPDGRLCPALQLDMELMKTALTPEFLASIRLEPDDRQLADLVTTGRTLTKPIEEATDMLKERIAAQGYVDSSTARITVKVGKGSYSYPDPEAFYATLTELLPDPDVRARALKFSISGAVEQIAVSHGIKKTGKSGVSAESIVEAKLKPLCQQGTRSTLVFS